MYDRPAAWHFSWQHLDRTVCVLVAERLAGSWVLHLFVLSAEAVGSLLQLLLLKMMMLMEIQLLLMIMMIMMTMMIVPILEVLLKMGSWK